MYQVLPNPSTLPLCAAARSRTLEAAAAAALPPHELMQRAGTAVAKLALALAPSDGPIALVCGPGNNGGDGLHAASLLRAHGRAVELRLLHEDRTPPADAAWALQQARAAGVTIVEQDAELPADCALVVDALLGLGLKRAPEGQLAQAIAAINRHRAPVLAVDLPSGLDGDSGALPGTPGAVVQADHTLALLSLKPGLFTGQGRACAGRIWFDALGLPAATEGDAWLSGLDLLEAWRAPARHDSHKGSHGDVLVLGGAPGMRGAALLAARAALAAGAGRVYACLLDSLAPELDPLRPELMHWAAARLQSPADWRAKVVVAGCGGGAAIATHLPALLHHAQRLVLDADALNTIAADAQLRSRLRQRRARGLQTILTPHPLEAARLLGCDSPAVQRDRLRSANWLAQELQCTVLLKGSGTVVASPDKPCRINPSGNGALATAGTGDVLAGWMGGLWAQSPDADPQRLAAAVAYWHGMAAEGLDHGPMRAADLVERMHALHAPAH